MKLEELYGEICELSARLQAFRARVHVEVLYSTPESTSKQELMQDLIIVQSRLEAILNKYNRGLSE